MLNANPEEERNLRWETALRWQVVTSSLTGLIDRPLLDQRIWMDTEQTLRVIDGLKERQWSVFGWPQARWVGMQKAQFAKAPGLCAGELRNIVPLTDGTGTIVEGWAGHKDMPGWEAWIILVDGDGVITGLAHGGALDIWAASIGAGYSGWKGYNRGDGTPTPYLVLPGNRLCPLNPWVT